MLAPRRGAEAANAENRRTKGQKNRRFDVCACRLPREHKNISFHKIHIRPLRGGRPRTIVRAASRNIRADAVAEGAVDCFWADAKRGFLLREGGFSVAGERFFCCSD